jgi:hypothetical protein
MTTIFGGDSIYEYYRPSNASSRSASPLPSVSASSSTTHVTSSQLCEGLDGKIQRYPGISRIRRAVNALSEKLREGKITDQYLVFRPVTVKELDEIDNRRYEIGKGIRLTYCADIKTLIIKVPTAAHELVSRAFGDIFVIQAAGMRVASRERMRLGSTTFKGTSSTSKEADESFKPATLRPHELDWPTLVLETSISESLSRLRNNARWWLSNSGSRVNIVLIFHINRGTKTILIERWETIPATGGPVTRSNQPPAIPTRMQAITIDQNNVTGTSLTLHFHQIFLRQPNPPERDLVFTAQDLRDWSDDVWAALR